MYVFINRCFHSLMSYGVKKAIFLHLGKNYFIANPTAKVRLHSEFS